MTRTPLLMFVNGQAMSGGLINHNLAEAKFLGQALTAPKYRFFSVRDEFPGIHAVEEDGYSVPGELYEVTYDILGDKLLPSEPLELELGVIELQDGSGTLCMQMRQEWLGHQDLTDISDKGGWRAYLDNKDTSTTSVSNGQA